MITFKFKLNNNTINATVPEGWHEVKLKHVVALENSWTGKSTDLIGLLAAFTGNNYSDLDNARGNLWEPLFQVLSFVFDAPKWQKLKRPDLVTMGDKQIKPPKKIELETFGQKVMALRLIAKEGDPIEKIPEILAIYLQPAYDGHFNSDRIEDIKPMILNMPAYQAMPYGYFFFHKLLRLKTFGSLGLKASRKIRKAVESIQQQESINSHNLTTS